MSGPVLRVARYGDFPEIAHMLARSFWDDELYGDRIHPRRNQFPQDVDLYWLRRARVNFWDWRWKCLVVVDKNADGKEVIAGSAQWVRKGDGGKKMDLWWFDPRRILKPLFSIAMKVHALIWPNRACDPSHEDMIERAYPFFSHVWSGPERGDLWKLDLLGVDPDFQGRGIGQMLVRPGLAWADNEGVGNSVIPCAGKDGFYFKCGYETRDGSATAGEGNPLAGYPGGNILWRAPKKGL